MRLFTLLLGLEGDCEVVPQSIDENYYSFVESLGMPAPFIDRAGSRAIVKVDRWMGALGALGEDESGEEEAAAEEVDGEGVEDTVQLSVGIHEDTLMGLTI
jgi:hypothetical protein